MLRSPTVRSQLIANNKVRTNSLLRLCASLFCAFRRSAKFSIALHCAEGCRPMLLVGCKTSCTGFYLAMPGGSVSERSQRARYCICATLNIASTVHVPSGRLEKMVSPLQTIHTDKSVTIHMLDDKACHRPTKGVQNAGGLYWGRRC